MVNKTKGVGTALTALAIAMAVMLSLTILPAMADDNETLPVIAEGNETNLSITTSQTTEEMLEVPEDGFTGFPYSVLFLETSYEVWRSHNSNILPAEGTTITAGLMPIGGNSTDWGIAEKVILSAYSGEHFYAYSPPLEALDKEYTIKFVAEYRNKDGVVYKQENSSVSDIFEVATLSS